ncbi:MAG: hypothetical protein KDI46_09155 [Alphaproteobacteria bacterium]|nr:hypothetical protein [Alphaproteobacteria bacterium]
MRILLIFLLFLVAPLSPAASMASNLSSAEQQYEAIKGQIQYSGSVGFDKRHKAYRDYILETRRNEASDVAKDVTNIEPAAGDAGEDTQPEQRTSPHYNQ